ncbi:uncharacterized protein LOC143180916 [Calliopsis andreniformis]|uniref:uncharacterized protein LOC143180916 n=1 Tax=Calliopsis andreniformis TaxID=337506 RepID=UPI003FCED5A0
MVYTLTKTDMKIQLLLLFSVSLTILMNVKEVTAKERKGVVERVSKSVSHTHAPDKINTGFEWMIRCVNILGQLDNFISDRTKNIVRKLHAIYHEDNRDMRKNFDRHKGLYRL